MGFLQTKAIHEYRHMMDKTRRTWTVNADADAASATLDATDSLSINLV